MTRNDFVKTSLFSLAAMATLNELRAFTDALPEEENTLPVVFVGHGNPMNAIEDNEFSQGWRKLGQELPKPKAILCISAHWETKGTFVTAMDKPPTIHDFYGFPKALNEAQYPAPGSPELAKQTQELVTSTKVGLDTQWGLDHGCWSVLKQTYPNADIPVVQLSMDVDKSPQWHYDLAKELAPLRKKGILIMGSGNMIHNLGMAAWGNPKGYDWAEELNVKFKDLLLKHEHKQLIDYQSLGKAAALAIPTNEHYLPMLYAIALQGKDEAMSFFNDKTIMGAFSMTSFRIG